MTILRSQSIATRKSLCNSIANAGLISSISNITRQIYFNLFGSEVVDRDSLNEQDLKTLHDAERDIAELIDCRGREGFDYWVARLQSKASRKKTVNQFFKMGYTNIRQFTKDVYLEAFGIDICDRDRLDSFNLLYLINVERRMLAQLPNSNESY